MRQALIRPVLQLRGLIDKHPHRSLFFDDPVNGLSLQYSVRLRRRQIQASGDLFYEAASPRATRPAQVPVAPGSTYSNRGLFRRNGDSSRNQAEEAVTSDLNPGGLLRRDHPYRKRSQAPGLTEARSLMRPV